MSILLISLLLWTLVRLHLTWTLGIPFLMSLPLTYLPPLPFYPFLLPPRFSSFSRPFESTFVESETVVLGSPCFDKTLDYSDIERLDDHFDVKALSSGHPMSFGCHISFDQLYPFPFGDVGCHLDHLDHSRWSMHSYSHIIIRPLTSVSDVACTHLSFD